jgi:hypothetical protein
MVQDGPGQKDEEVGREDTLHRKKLVRLTIAVGAVLAVALLVSLGFALRWYLSPQTDLSISQRQALVQGLASAGQALAVLLTGTVGLIGLYLTRQLTNEQLQQARKSQEATQRSTQETLRLTEQGQITERFTRAIDQLGATDDKTGEPRLEIRLGGIYALERIDKESHERAYHATVMEVLTAYVRENSRRHRGQSSTSTSAANEATEQDIGVERDTEPTDRRPPADIQAILDVLHRREETSIRSGHRVVLNLQRADLRGANLVDAELEAANLMGANLQGANLRGVQLDWTIGDKTTALSEGLIRPEMWSKSITEQWMILEERYSKSGG